LYYFQYTITPYHSDIETGLASKKEAVIPAFLDLSAHIGARRMIWRYDPIVITPRYSVEYHIRAFSKLCGLLAGSTEKCVISFVIAYKSVAKNLAEIGQIELEIQSKIKLAKALLSIAKDHGITLCACCELPELGLQPISCVDASLFGVDTPRDKHQRSGCNCAVSIDIGAYNSCMNGCRYCYANHSEAKVRASYLKHNANAEFLVE
jgi:hypothetical protein